MTLEEFRNQVEKMKKSGIRPGGRPPNSGINPNETCRTCKSAVKVEAGNRNVYKCAKNERWWTNSINTDIRLKDTACGFWEKDSASQD